MKKSFTFLLFPILSLTSFTTLAQTFTFSYTGAMQSWTVPVGAHFIAIDAQGARGGAAGPVGGLIGATTPGCGGRVQANLSVTPGQVLNINIGGSGMDAIGTSGSVGGYNGGGSTRPWIPISPTYSGGGGGGKTDISAGVITMIVAGGGGGAGYNGSCPSQDQPGGNGGGATAASITTCDATLFAAGFTTVRHAGGGSQTAGGVGGFLCCGGYYAGTAGTAGIGGNVTDSGGIAGAGGGGYYGGGGGCWSGGGGGSSYTIPALTQAVIHTAGFNCGAGKVTICILDDPGTLSGLSSLCIGDTTTLALTGATAGGTWSSGSASVATVGSTGFVTGVSAGTVTISYAVVTAGCGTAYAIDSVTINPFPVMGPITGHDTVCPGHHTVLADTTTGGTWSSGTAAKATIGSATGIVTGIVAGSSVITYTATRLGCTSKTTVNVIVSSKVPCVSGVPGVPEMLSEISVFPNPGYGVFTISAASVVNTPVTFTVSGLLGQKITELMTETNRPVELKLDVPPGFYILTAATGYGMLSEKISVLR